MITDHLLSRCRAGDSHAQRELYDQFKSMVMGLCRRYTARKEEAEDVFQDAFVQVFQNISQIRDSGNLGQWIRRIAVNTAIKYYHRNKRHEHAEERNGFDHPNDDYAFILSQFTDTQLITLISELPERYRMVFNLYVVEGFNHAEIGELLHISEASSRSQLSRAKQNLKDRLKTFGILKYERYA